MGSERKTRSKWKLVLRRPAGKSGGGWVGSMDVKALLRWVVSAREMWRARVWTLVGSGGKSTHNLYTRIFSRSVVEFQPYELSFFFFLFLFGSQPSILHTS